MKICFYALREYDELIFAKELARKTGIDFVYTVDYPDETNLSLATGCQVVSTTPVALPESYIQKFHDLGVQLIAARSIGYDNIDLKACQKWGMHVSNASYPPEGVANYKS